MIVYFITVLLVILFTGLAQTLDHPRLSGHNGQNIVHSSATNILLFMTIALLVFVSGFRYFVGTDYRIYYNSYRLFANSLRQSLLSLREPGFPFLCRIAILLGGGGEASIFLAALVTVLPALRTIYRKTDRLLLASLLYIFLGCWHGSFNGVRQCLAATMLFCGYEYLEAKNLKKYLFWVFMAFLFHRSAIVMAVLIFVVHREVNTRNLLLIFFGIVFVLLAYDRVLAIAGWITESEYSLEDAYTVQKVSILRVLAAAAPAVVFLVMYLPKEKNQYQTFCLNLLIIHAAMRVATMNSALLYRIGIYTTLFQTIAIPELLKGLNSSIRRVIIFFMITLFAVFWWYELQGSYYLSNFRWIWDAY